jgi:hypothetical protein
MFATLDRSIAIKTLFTKRVPAADTGAARRGCSPHRR